MDGTSSKFFRQRFQQLGRTYAVNNWGRRKLETMDKENVRTVLATSFKNFGVRNDRDVGQPLFGPGVFTSDGPYWEHSRALLRPMLARKEIADFSHFDIHMDRLLDQIPRDGSTVELQKLLNLMFLDHATEMIFGESTNTLLRPEVGTKASPLLATFSRALSRIGIYLLLGKLGKFYFPWDRTYLRLANDVIEVIDKYIDAAIERQKKGETVVKERYIIVDELVALDMSREEIRHQLIGFFLPARDSISTGLGGILFHLARHQKVWDRLRAEVLETLQRENGVITYSVLQGMTYMKAVLNESLRFIVPAVEVDRECFEDTILPHGGGPDGTAPVFVQKGDSVKLHLGCLQTDPEFWGVDALEFNPDRWLRVTDSTESRNRTGSEIEAPGSRQLALRPGWAYIPFSGGPRICPGQQIVLLECAYSMVRIMERFEKIENRDPEWNYVEGGTLTLQSKNGVQVGLYAAA